MIPFQIGAKFKVTEGSAKLGIPRHVAGYIDDIRPLGAEHNHQVAVHLRFLRGDVKARRLFAVHLNRLDDNFVKLNAGGGATNGSIRIQLTHRAPGDTTAVTPNAGKTVYVLKNHNGTVLARHTDIKKLTAEMLKYEAQTGNRTRIEVQLTPNRRRAPRRRTSRR